MAAPSCPDPGRAARRRPGGALDQAPGSARGVGAASAVRRARVPARRRGTATVGPGSGVPVIGPGANHSRGEWPTLGVVRGDARSWLYAGTDEFPGSKQFTGLWSHPPAEAEVFDVAFENARMPRPGDASLSAVRDRGTPDSGAGPGIAAVVRRVIVTARCVMPLTPGG